LKLFAYIKFNIYIYIYIYIYMYICIILYIILISVFYLFSFIVSTHRCDGQLDAGRNFGPHLAKPGVFGNVCHADRPPNTKNVRVGLCKYCLRIPTPVIHKRLFISLYHFSPSHYTNYSDCTPLCITPNAIIYVLIYLPY
jgi:hypothetical protein